MKDRYRFVKHFSNTFVEAVEGASTARTARVPCDRLDRMRVAHRVVHYQHALHPGGRSGWPM